MEQISEGGVDFEALRVLVIDDDAAMRHAIATMLTGLPVAEVRQAASVREGMAVLQDWRPDIALVDYVMRGGTGVDFVRAVRDRYDGDGRRLPIILLTGHADMAKLTAAKLAGAHDFVIKPFGARTLVERIERVLSDGLTIGELEERARQRGPR